MRDRMTRDLACGTIAGLIGTALVKAMMVATRKIAPEKLPPVREDPGSFMVKQAERLLPETAHAKVPEWLETAAAQSLAFGYGTTAAVLYIASRPGKERIIWDGAALGTLTWAIGYLGWLPAAKLTPPVWKQKPMQVIPNIFSHLMFGVATLAIFHGLRGKG